MVLEIYVSINVPSLLCCVDTNLDGWPIDCTQLCDWVPRPVLRLSAKKSGSSVVSNADHTLSHRATRTAPVRASLARW